MPLHKFRATPRFPNDKDVAPAAATLMYWSRAPVYGTLPMRTMRAHTVTLIDSVAWLFGGCDDKESAKDIYLFDTGAERACTPRSPLTPFQTRCSGRTPR